MSKSGTIGLWVAVALLAIIAGGQIDSFIAAAKAGAHGEVQYACSANLNEFTCTATNLNAFEVLGICVTGKLVPKGQGTTAEAVPICTGPMKARSTVHIASHWAKGSPTSACPSDSRFPDWERCDFFSAQRQ